MVNVNDKIYFYEIRIDFLKNTTTKKNSVHDVIGANETFLVINDLVFTKLNQATKLHYRSINEVRTSHFLLGSYYDEVVATLYSNSKNDKKAYKSLKNKLEKFLDEKFGRYCKGIELLNAMDLEEEQC